MRAVISVLLLFVAGCGAGRSMETPVQSGTSQPSEPGPAGGGSRIQVSPALPSAPGRTSAISVRPLTPTEAPQRTDTGVFADPVTVTSAWLHEWCATDWREPMNANLARAARYQTLSAAKADLRVGDDENTYRSAHEQQLSSGCDEIVVRQSPEAPQGANLRYLLLSARRVNSAAGVTFEAEQVRSMRRVILQPDGRWLVAEQVEAG